MYKFTFVNIKKKKKNNWLEKLQLFEKTISLVEKNNFKLIINFSFEKKTRITLKKIKVIENYI